MKIDPKERKVSDARTICHHNLAIPVLKKTLRFQDILQVYLLRF